MDCGQHRDGWVEPHRIQFQTAHDHCPIQSASNPGSAVLVSGSFVASFFFSFEFRGVVGRQKHSAHLLAIATELLCFGSANAVRRFAAFCLLCSSFSIFCFFFSIIWRRTVAVGLAVSAAVTLAITVKLQSIMSLPLSVSSHLSASRLPLKQQHHQHLCCNNPPPKSHCSSRFLTQSVGTESPSPFVLVVCP